MYMSQLLLTKKLCASYNKRQILSNVSFEIKRGEVLCICGPNGVGKSTLLKILSGLDNNSLKIDSAEIYPSLDNTKISSLKRKECARKIAYMAQLENSVWNFSVKDIVLTGRFPYTTNGNYSKEDFAKVEEVLRELEICDKGDRLVHTLSGGEFQKVRIARALCQEPEFIIMDEPASSLDFVYEPHLLDYLKKIAVRRNIGIIISIHDVNYALKYSDKLLLLCHGGQAIFGNSSEVLTTENLKMAYGVDFICKEIKSFQSLV